MTWQVGRYAGSALIELIGTTSPEYNGLPTIMIIKSACRLLPLLTVPFLVPQGTPADTAEAMGAKGGVTQDAPTMDTRVIREMVMEMTDSSAEEHTAVDGGPSDESSVEGQPSRGPSMGPL